MAKLLFLGDLFYDYDFISEDIENLSNWIKQNDFQTVINLEGVVPGDAKPVKKRGPNLASNGIVIEVLRKLNTVGVCLANNHAMDFGWEGLLNTINLLNANGIKYVGAGQCIEQAISPMIVDGAAILNFGWDVEETVYATGYSGGCAPRTDDIILSAVEQARSSAARVIVCIHWGFEYNRLPMPYDVELAHRILEAGADLIIGTHPHCVQPRETYGGKHVYYSLGNFYFAGRRKSFTKRFHEKVDNQSDYGAMVAYDTAKELSREWLIRYDLVSESSLVLPLDESVLEDITGINYLSWYYLNEVKKRKQNINPVLSTDEKQNAKALRRLFCIYKTKAVVKKLLGRGRVKDEKNF